MSAQSFGRLVIYGAGGLGRESMVLARELFDGSGVEIAGFIDDGVEAGTVRNDAPVLGGIDWFDGIGSPVGVVLGIADSGAKEKIYTRLKRDPRISFPNLIHPTCVIRPYCSLGEGIIMQFGTNLSIDIVVGSCVLLNSRIGLGHDVTIGDFSTIMPGASISGCVSIGRKCLVGTMSAIHQGISVGDGATVGMGAVVMRDVPPGATVLGNPAKRIA